MKSFKMYTKNNSDASKSDQDAIKAILGLIVIAATVWYFWFGGWQMQTGKLIDETYKKVSADAVEQYNIAKRQGDKIQICVQAGFAAAAYLQEKNEPKYQEWKSVEKSDCAYMHSN